LPITRLNGTNTGSSSPMAVEQKKESREAEGKNKAFFWGLGIGKKEETRNRVIVEGEDLPSLSGRQVVQ